jgi:hypothetical protein
MSRSMAAMSENRTCNLSSPRNGSGIHGSGRIVGRKKDGPVSRETHCSSGSLQTMSSSLCVTWSALNTCWTNGSQATTHAASGVEGTRFNLAGEWVDMAVGDNTGGGSKV